MAEQGQRDRGGQRGWQDHSRQQLLRFALETTPAQRLAWLEEMLLLAQRTRALPRRRTEERG